MADPIERSNVAGTLNQTPSVEEPPRPVTAQIQRKSYLNEAIAVVIGAIIVTVGSLTQTCILSQSEEKKMRRDSELRLSENRRAAYEQFLRTADDYHRAAVSNAKFFSSAPNTDPNAIRLLSELSAGLDRLLLIGGAAVLHSGKEFHDNIQTSFKHGRLPPDYEASRRKFADAARAELGVPTLR